MGFWCQHGSCSPPWGVSEAYQPQGSFLLTIEVLGLLVATLRGRILRCCFWGWGSRRELSFTALLHTTMAAVAKSRQSRASVSPRGLWAGGDGLRLPMTSLCLAREGQAWCLEPHPHPCRDKRRQQGALVEGDRRKQGPGRFSPGAPRKGDVAAPQHCSGHAQRAREA